MIIGPDAAGSHIPTPGMPGQADDVIHGGNIGQYQHIVASRIAKVEVSQQACQDDFKCRVTEATLGQIRITHIQSSPFELIRSARCIASDSHNEYLVGLNLSGGMLVDHYRSQTRVKATQMFLLDKAAPYQTTFTDDSERIIFSVPRRLIEHQLPEPSRYFQCTPSISEGIGKLAYQHILLLMNESHRFNDMTRMQLSQMCLDLIALSFRSYDDVSMPPVRHGGNGRMLLSRVKAHIRCVLGDPDLNPGMVADSMGLSRRYLHKLFADDGATFGAWVRHGRLMRARTLLADPRFHHLSIKEIALQQGFNDIPNFSRQFKAQYRQTPSDLRASACRNASILTA